MVHISRTMQGVKSAVKIIFKMLTLRHDDSDDSSDDEDCEVIENIRYNHTCVCSHLIAKHKYKFWIEDGRQEYRMDCMLCGIAEDSSSILPHDPRKASTLEC